MSGGFALIIAYLQAKASNNRIFRLRLDVRKPQPDAKSLGACLPSTNMYVFGEKNMHLIDKVTGDRFVIDQRMARIRRCQKRVHAWAGALDEIIKQVGTKYRMMMVRLSYAPGYDWKPLQISHLITKIHYELRDNLIAYSWVAELQERGAVHYHLLMIVKRGTDIPYFDDAAWWIYGSTHHCTARSPFYICSYTAKKNYQKFGVFPKNLRMFAIWIAPGLVSSSARRLLRLTALPSWVARIARAVDDFKAMCHPGGGWDINGQLVPSPYKVVF